MSMKGSRRGSTVDEAENFYDSGVDLEAFVETMGESKHSESVPKLRSVQQREERAAWRRVDDCRDARWLKEQLSDWDD